jgi:phage baseplate assembly protein gpV
MSRRHGVVSAFVKSVDASQGRVQVEYRAIDDQLQSTWAPIASPLSGKSRGALFMPESGDEVLIAFGDGEFDTPFVVGCLWNGEQVSPEKSADNRVIVTPGGHQLRFEDKKNDSRIILKSAGGHQITLEDKAPGKKIEIKSTQHTVTLDDTAGSSNITLAAGPGGTVSVALKTTPPSVTVTTVAGTVTLDASGLSISTTSAITIASAGAATINCTAATVTAASTTLNTAVLSVNAPIATFAGVVQCTALIAEAVSSPLYTPGIGNFI